MERGETYHDGRERKEEREERSNATRREVTKGKTHGRLRILRQSYHAE
jgi:hypothetical protein